MNLARLYCWIYGDEESKRQGAKEFYDNLKRGLESGIAFPFDCPYQVYLLKNTRATESVVAVFVKRGTLGDDSIEISEKLDKWYEACGGWGVHDSVCKSGNTFQSAIGGLSYSFLETFGNIESSDFLKNNEIQNQQRDPVVQSFEQPKSAPIETSTPAKVEVKNGQMQKKAKWKFWKK